MCARSTLCLIEDADHSLVVAKASLKSRGETQEDADRKWLDAVAAFLNRT